MRFTRPRFRIHLLTGILAMLAASVLLGLNLQRREATTFNFTLRNSHTPAISCIMVNGRQHISYGWPKAELAGSEDQSRFYFTLPPDSPDLQRVPICLNLCATTKDVSIDEIARVAPRIFQKIQNQNSFEPQELTLYPWAIALHSTLAIVLLFVFSALVELGIRRWRSPRASPATQLQPGI